MTRHVMAMMLCFVVLGLTAGCDYDGSPSNPDLNQTQLRAVALTAPAIGDRVWYDTDMDGIQGDSVNEPGIAGVTVDLFTCDSIPAMVAQTVTDETGFYAFDSLAAGSYFLVFTGPEGYVLTLRDQGSDDELDSDADPATGGTSCILIDSVVVDLSNDAGMFMVDTINGAVVSDRVWNDVDMDGIQGDETAEPGMEGVMVWLYTCADEMVDSTTTDDQGYYSFMGVAPGEYYLMFDLPDGYLFSEPNQGPSDWADSDADGFTGQTDCFMVAENVVYSFWDAGMYIPADSGCTRSKGYWKNHGGLGPQEDLVTDLLPIWLGDDDGDKSLAVTDAQMAYDVLQMHTYGYPSNGIAKLYAQLLAAKLNIASGALYTDISDVILEADEFLAEYDYTDWDMLEKDQMKMVLRWMGTLDDFNNGIIGPGYCDSDDNMDDDSPDDE
jgi:hypothetical protein